MRKSDLDCLKNIPNIFTLVRGFSFIDNAVLKDNIALTMQYIMFLLAITQNHSLPGAVNFMVYKDMIIHTASISESILCYALETLIHEKRYTLEQLKLRESGKEYTEYQRYKNIGGIEVGIITKCSKYISPQEAQFNQLIKAGTHIQLLKDDLCKELDALRILRNNIHLGTLDDVDDSYTVEQVNAMFGTVKKLKQTMMNFLTQ